MITFKKTKPKVFYDLMGLFNKINEANKNVKKYERMTILEPYVLKNIVNVMEGVSQKDVDFSAILSNIEIAREFFIYFSENRAFNYKQNYVLEITLGFENIVKQLNGWKKSKSREDKTS